ncbi:FtsX-like permease family protein [Oxalobacteraceae bacterium OM1]|nr:FtsX-like permease family protein [Oxalobacteraceae bacterium OM1]
MEIRPILSALLRNKTAPLLVAIQVAISLAILANALFIVTLRIEAAERPSGIADEANIAHFYVRPIEKLSHNEILARQQRELATLAALPGVVSAAWVSQMPMSRSGSSSSVRSSLSQTQPTADPATYFGHPGLVQTLGLKLVEGRDFNNDDVVEKDPEVDSWNAKFPKGVIITQALARLLFPDAANYAGKTFYFGMGVGNEVRVIGVVERLQTPQAQSSAAGEYSVILPWRTSMPYSRYVVRTAPGERDRVAAAAEEALRKSSTIPMNISARTTEQDRINRYRNEKALAWMLISVSGLLLLVTVSGIVGMTTLRVAQRRKQIGVRRALGARWRDIVRYFITENLLITTSGIAAGLLLAVALNQLLIRQLELSKLPAGYLVAGAVALWLLGIASVYGPAARAARISPAIATRTA